MTPIDGTERTPLLPAQSQRPPQVDPAVWDRAMQFIREGQLAASQSSQQPAPPITQTPAQTLSLQASSQNPIQIDPAGLARAMQGIPNPTSQPATSTIAQAHTQQTLSTSYGQYIGELQNDSPHGRGTLTFHPGLPRKNYEGEWKNGWFHGRGVLKWSNGNRDEGQWENGKLHGQGIRFYASGAKYEGPLFQGKAHGKGSLRTANGDTYVGDLENDAPHGKGTMIYADGGKYVGDWKNGHRDGQGHYSDAYLSYSGEWLEGKCHGQGEKWVGRGSMKGIFKNGSFWTGISDLGDNLGSFTYVDGVSSRNWCRDICLIQ